MNKHQEAINRTEHNGAREVSAARFERLQALGAIPGRLKTRAEENPRAAVIVLAATAFVMGGLMGARLGRLALAACVPLLISRALDGTLSKDLSRLAGTPETVTS